MVRTIPVLPRPVPTAIGLPRDVAAYYATVARQPLPFLLESAAGGRHSFLGSNPYAILTARGTRLSIWREGREKSLTGNPFDVLDELLSEQAVENDQNLPLPCGAVGLFGYDLGRHLEELPRRAKDDLGFPDLCVGLYDRIVAYDHETRRAQVVELPSRASKRALTPGQYDEAFVSGETTAGTGSNFTRERYLDAVKRAREYILAGEIYQVNLSQRFHARCEDDRFDVYRRLREASPARFAALMEFGGRAVISASPELFLEVRGRTVTTRPIKGTRPRGASIEEDERLRLELLGSAKDDAELAMIVDLERNDLGRVCEYGTVRVTAPKSLESHATVHHLSATVEGTLRSGTGPVDVLRAAFPGGSITGAPKVRAMEIIDELEPTRRAFYTGAIGHVGFDGSMQLSIAIRTILADGPDHWFQAGGAITADSDPEAEYRETLAKAKASARALGVRLR